MHACTHARIFQAHRLNDLSTRFHLVHISWHPFDDIMVVNSRVLRLVISEKIAENCVQSRLIVAVYDESGLELFRIQILPVYGRRSRGTSDAFSFQRTEVHPPEDMTEDELGVIDEYGAGTLLYEGFLDVQVGR